MRLATLTLLVAPAAAVDMHLTTGDFHMYPGYAGHVHVEHGSVDFFKGEHDGEDAVHFQLELRLNDGMCSDYQPSMGAANACGAHIHAGHSCDDAGGHYFVDPYVTEDPWTNSYYHTNYEWSDEDDRDVMVARADYTVVTGAFRAQMTLANFTGLTFVVHDNTGARMACAPIEGPGDDYYRALYLEQALNCTDSANVLPAIGEAVSACAAGLFDASVLPDDYVSPDGMIPNAMAGLAQYTKFFRDIAALPTRGCPAACHDLDQLLATLTSTCEPAARFAESVGKVVNATMANGCDLLDCAKLQAAKAAEALEACLPANAPPCGDETCARPARGRPAAAAPARPPAVPPAPSLPASQVHGGDRRAHRHAVPRRGRGVVFERVDGRRRRRRHRHRRAARLVAAPASELLRLEGRARRACPRDRRPARQRVLVRHRAPSRVGRVRGGVRGGVPLVGDHAAVQQMGARAAAAAEPAAAADAADGGLGPGVAAAAADGSRPLLRGAEQQRVPHPQL